MQPSLQNHLGQLGLLIAFVGSGYAAFAWAMGSRRGLRRSRHEPCAVPGGRHGACACYSGIGRTGDVAAAASVLALTAVTGILAWALLVKDFRFAYVADYSSRLLPWHYSLSAFWVGQAGSLLLWAWFLGVLAMAYRFWPRRNRSPLRPYAFAVLMACLCFLVAIMVFGADPMEPSRGTLQEGAGLSPLLQHPAMLVHPPIVFLGYAGWTIPFALAMAALLSGRLDANWVREARGWALFAWVVLGGGILWGGLWAYEELGWGGYWGWDPVENGSLIPWLTGTALVHTSLAWQYRGVLKKTTLFLAIATFALSNFATFVTRSGIFSSLHAFGRCTIGWMFLAWMVALVAGGGTLTVFRSARLGPDRPLASLWARESLVLMGTVALLLLAGVTWLGTLAAPLSDLILGQAIVLGPPFYNNVLIPTGLVLLPATAAAPLLRWGNLPGAKQQRTLLLSAGVGTVAAILAFSFGVRHPIALAVAWLAALSVAALAGALILDVIRRPSGTHRGRVLATLAAGRRRYAGFLVHLGFVCLAVGVTGSSLGTRRRDVRMCEGQAIRWAGRSIRFEKLRERKLPDKLVAEAILEVSRHGDAPQVLLPAQHLHSLGEEWTTEVAIHSTWGGDLYTILTGGQEDGSVSLTLVENPLMRWIWCGGWLMAAGAFLGLWPAPRRFRQRAADRPPAAVRTSTGLVPPAHRDSKRRAA